MMTREQVASQTGTVAMQAETGFVFDLDGGRACLDFANTLSSSTGEHVHGYADLLAFAIQSQLLTQVEADKLHARAKAEPTAAESVMARAYRLRAAIYAIFSSIAADRRAAEGELEALNAELGFALQHACVEWSWADGGYRYGWNGVDQLDAPLWPLARSAAEMLVSEQDRLRVRECGGDDCRWLFIDTSRNRSRQWCSMSSCGNRRKAKRHYQRVRERTRT
jgi:predicted RNA-binding Zn ribbon-like protein